jgi:hypothetical protein
MRILKAGVVYFLILFALGWGPIRVLWAGPKRVATEARCGWFGAAMKRSAVLFSSAVTWRESAALPARPKSQSTRSVEHFRSCVMAVGAQQNLDPRPMAAPQLSHPT